MTWRRARGRWHRDWLRHWDTLKREKLGEVVGEDELVQEGSGIGPGKFGERGLQSGEFLVADGGVGRCKTCGEQ